MRSSLLVPGACAIVAALTISGCDDGEPDGGADSTPSAPSTSSTGSTSGASSTPPASSGPSMPAKAAESGADGAKAYVGHYVDIVNYAADTGDTKPLSAASTDCEYCQQFSAVYDDMYANGGSFDGKLYELEGVDVKGEASAVRAVATVKSRSAVTFRISKDAERRNPKSRTFTWTFDLRRADEGWQIVGMAETF